MACKGCCFFYEKGCRVLTMLVCDRRRCTFSQTQEERNEHLKKYPPFDYTYYKETGRKIYNGRGYTDE